MLLPYHLTFKYMLFILMLFQVFILKIQPFLCPLKGFL